MIPSEAFSMVMEQFPFKRSALQAKLRPYTVLRVSAF
jgi:hypothetical protein